MTQLTVNVTNEIMAKLDIATHLYRDAVVSNDMVSAEKYRKVLQSTIDRHDIVNYRYPSVSAIRKANTKPRRVNKRKNTYRGSDIVELRKHAVVADNDSNDSHDNGNNEISLSQDEIDRDNAKIAADIAKVTEFSGSQEYQDRLAYILANS